MQEIWITSSVDLTRQPSLFFETTEKKDRFWCNVI